MNEYKQPVHIATIDKKNQITWNFDVLKTILQTVNGKRIMIIVCISNYQIGKTSLIMTMSGNPNHVIGDGSEAETSGATIDGPYSIQYIARRFDVQQYFNVSDDQAIFFIDVEGFGCFNRGNEKEMQAFFSKLCTPLISISSIVIFPSELNGNQSSMNQITSLLRFNDFAINTMNENGDLICTKLVLMPLIRNINFWMNIDYSVPNQSSYNELTRFLTEKWEKMRFRDNHNFTILTRPLPLYSQSRSPLNQNNTYNDGIKFVIIDVLNILMNPNGRLYFNNVDLLCNFLSTIIRSVNSLNVSIPKEINDFFTSMINGKISLIYNESIKPSCNLIVSEYIKDNENIQLYNHIELNEDTILENISISCTKHANTEFHNQLPARYFEREEVNEQIKFYLNEIDKFAQSQVSNIKTSLLRSISQKANICKNEIISYLRKGLLTIIKELKDKSIFNYIPKEEEIFNTFNLILCETAKILLKYLIRKEYYDLEEYQQVADEIDTEIEKMIKLEMSILIDDLKSKKFFQKMARGAVGTIVGAATYVTICSGLGAAAAGFAEIISFLTSDVGVGFTCVTGGYYGVLGISCDPSHESYGKIGERKGVAAIGTDGEASEESEKKVIKEFIANVSNKQIINPNPENNTEALL